MLGVVDHCAFYIDARVDEAWGSTQLALDVAPGNLRASRCRPDRDSISSPRPGAPRATRTHRGDPGSLVCTPAKASAAVRCRPRCAGLVGKVFYAEVAR